MMALRDISKWCILFEEEIPWATLRKIIILVPARSGAGII
jgi:hypothetical protein